MTRARKVQFEVSPEDAGKRIDQVLAARIPELSRRQARVLLDIGGVFVDRARVKVASRKVRPGQTIEAHLGGALERATKSVGRAARARDAAELPRFGVMFEDEDIVVVDKPAGLLTAPTPESDRNNLAEALGRDRPQVLVVHRIDLQTSGLLVFAKSEEANRSLSARFREHDVERAYTAVVAGSVEGDAHTVQVPVKGRRAVTHLQVTERIGSLATVLEARLETGRTHQIRIHCRHLGHPVLGDRDYGRGRALASVLALALEPPRMALHARLLGIVHPRTGERLVFDSPLPDELDAWLQALRAAAMSAASAS